MSTQASPERPLVFASWEQRSYALTLLGFLGLSLFAHTATFFLFQVVYPQRVTIPPPAPQVSLLTPSNPESKALLDWVDAENPALVAAVTQAPAKGLDDVLYKPSFGILRTAPRTPAVERAKTFFPAGRDPSDLIRSVTPPLLAPQIASTPSRTKVTVSPALAARPFAKPPVFQPISDAPLNNAQVLAGVSDRGEIKYAFVQRSSGSAAADADALARLRSASFAPSEAPITWGFLTIAWGDDVYLNQPHANSPSRQTVDSPSPSPKEKSPP